MNRRAFTLIELLVSVGIIAVLLALLLPALKKASEQSHQIACMNNLRQIGMGFFNYTRDNEDAYPPIEEWCYYQAPENPTPLVTVKGLIPSAMGSNISPTIFQCPSDNIQAHFSVPYSYTANRSLCLNLGTTPIIRTSTVVFSSQVILIIDESTDSIDDLMWVPNHYPAEGSNILSNRHDRDEEDDLNPNAGRGNVLYADYHVEFAPRVESTMPENYLAYPGEPVN